MRKSTSRLLISITLLVASTTVSAQTEGPSSAFNYFSNPQNRAIWTINTHTDKEGYQKPQRMLAEKDHDVDFVLNFDSEEYLFEQIIIYNKDASKKLMGMANGSNIRSVPEGTYDIMALFYKLDPAPWNMFLYPCFIVKENVAITEGAVITLSPNEAKNHIHFQTNTINNEPIRTATMTVDENYNYTTIDNGNIDDLYFYTYLVSKRYGLIYTSGGNFGPTIQNMRNAAEQMADIYVNDVSDQYVFNSYRIFYKDGTIFSVNYEEEGAGEDVTIVNAPSEFTLYEELLQSNIYNTEETRYPSLIFYSQMKEGGSSYMSTTLAINSYPLTKDETTKFYIAASLDKSNIGLVPYIVPIQSTIIMEDIVEPLIKSKPIAKENGTIYFVNNGGGVMEAISYLDNNDDIAFYPTYPGTPNFSYPADSKNGELGNNCPVFTAIPSYSYNQRTGKYIGAINFDNIGRFGETTSNFNTDTKITIIVNDEDVYNTAFFWQSEEELTGTIDVTLENTKIMVDELQGKNLTKLHYTASDADATPPIIQILHFRNNQGIVTDRFDNTNDGHFEFVVGDFQRKLTEDGLYYYDRQIPTSVKVTYSPYDKGAWKALEVEEVPENFWPTMGWFYRGTLADVTGMGQDGWFDLKIKVTDEAGNWQEQVISPAFRINDLIDTGISSITNGQTTITGRYTLDGKRISTPQQGLNIVRMSDGTVKKVMVK